MRLLRLAIVSILLFVGWPASGQPLTTPVNVTPDCLIFYDFADNGSSASFDNRFLGCKTWYVAYTSTGFPALTLTFQDAPDNNGVAGAFVLFAGTIVEGVNPNVALTQASTIMYGYYPWVRITLSGAVAGAGRRLRGTFYGYRQVPVATVLLSAAAVVTANQGAPNTAGNRWPVYLSDGVNPQGTTANPFRTAGAVTPVDGLSNAANVHQVYPFEWNGATWDRQLVCTSRAAIALAGAGNTQIVAAVAATRIRVCHLSLAFQAAVDVQVTEGTGANCAVGTANVTGLYEDVLTAAFDFDSPLLGTLAQALCINLGAGITGGGVITYAQY